jgi:hypothetical protein
MEVGCGLTEIRISKERHMHTIWTGSGRNMLNVRVVTWLRPRGVGAFFSENIR